MPVNHVKEYLISVHTSVVFSHFYVRASNCSHYSNFGNKCPKLGTGTPEDILFTNLGDNLDSVPSEIVLLHIYTTYVHMMKSKHLIIRTLFLFFMATNISTIKGRLKLYYSFPHDAKMSATYYVCDI